MARKARKNTPAAKPQGTGAKACGKAQGTAAQGSGGAVTNFGRFYASFNVLPWSGDREDFKAVIVQEYTNGRTASLREMTREEYDTCCDALERLSGRRERLKKECSTCLKQMQQMGIDTSDWAQINSFCQHPRIAGKPFARLSIEELAAMSKRMRAIARKGWERKPKADASGTGANPAGEPQGTGAGKMPLYMIMMNGSNLVKS